MARKDRSTASPGVSLAKGPVSIVGMVLLAYGVTGLIFGGTSFDSSPLDGTVQGETWLGIEGNGWSNLLAIGAGGLLLFAAQVHWGAKSMALIVGLGFAAAAVIALVDGNDVLGIFAANDATKLAWAIAAAVLVVLALLPRVGRKPAVEPEPVAAAEPGDDRTLTTGETTTARRDPRFDRTTETARADDTVAARRAEPRP